MRSSSVARSGALASTTGNALERLRSTLEQLFDSLIPLEKLDLLRAWGLYEVADEAPLRIM